MTLVNLMQFFFRRFAFFLVASIFLGSVHAQTFQRVEQADFGKTRDGTEVKLITLRKESVVASSARRHLRADLCRPERLPAPFEKRCRASDGNDACLTIRLEDLRGVERAGGQKFSFFSLVSGQKDVREIERGQDAPRIRGRQCLLADGVAAAKLLFGFRQTASRNQEQRQIVARHRHFRVRGT